jgi:hypothetical protein
MTIDLLPGPAVPVLAEPPQDAPSTLMRDASHFEGAITVDRGAGIVRLPDDPFARIVPAQILSFDAGVLGGCANPWPWDRFDA